MINKEELIKLEEEFEFEKAMELYKELAADENCETEILEKYGKLLIEFGEIREAEKIYEILQKRDNKNIKYKEILGNINEELEIAEKAIEFYSDAGKKDDAERVNKKIFYNNMEDKYVEKFMELFSGREDIFAVQWSYDGKNGYSPQRRKIQKKDITTHLKGEKTLGIYQLKVDNSIKFGAFDIDIKKGIKFESDEDTKEMLKECVISIYREISSIGFKPYIEFSGNKGYHIWIFFESPVQSYKVKKVMENCLYNIESDEKIGIEIFPKQTEVNGEGMGNLIKIPLGIHKKTGKRCLFTDEELNIAEDQKKFLENIEYTTVISVEKNYIEDDRVIETSDRKSVNRERKTDIKKEIRRDIPIREEYKEELKILKSSCSVILFFIEKAEKTGFLTLEEEKILIAILKNCHYGERGVKDVLSKTINYSETRVKTIINSSSKYPISCENIRRKISEAGIKIDLENCCCKFSERFNTPINYLYNLDEYLKESLDTEDIIRKIMEKQKEKSEIEKETESLKRILNMKMENESEECYIGTIRKKGDSIEIIV